MAGPGDRKYCDERGRDLTVCYDTAKNKNSFLVQKAIRPFARILLFTLRTRVSGRENIPERGCVLVSSHESVIDPFIIAFACRKIPLRFVAKSQLFFFPMTKILLSLGAFPIKRGSSDYKSFDIALSALSSNQRVILFPQGGTHAHLHPDTARWGAGYLAQKTERPVIPVRVFCTKGKRHIVFGEPRMFSDNQNPSRQENITVAREVLSMISGIQEPA